MTSGGLPVGVSLRAVSGSAPNAAWAVGDKGTILGWDGLSWNQLTSATTRDLFGVWAGGPTDVRVVGRYQSILRPP